MDTQLDDAQFTYDYEDKERGFNPLLWMVYTLRRIRGRALAQLYDPESVQE